MEAKRAPETGPSLMSVMMEQRRLFNLDSMSGLANGPGENPATSLKEVEAAQLGLELAARCLWWAHKYGRNGEARSGVQQRYNRFLQTDDAGRSLAVMNDREHS